MKSFSVLACALSALLIQGCAGSVSSMVKETEKDASFGFDRSYRMSVDHPGGRQQLGSGWFVNCSARKFSSSLSVKNSEVRWRVDKDTEVTGYINADGKFRLEHELESREDVKGRGTTLSDGSVTLILQGNLSDDVMKGLFVEGIAQFTNRGCEFPVDYSVIS